LFVENNKTVLRYHQFLLSTSRRNPMTDKEARLVRS
jgi:hypothetical protein